MLTILICFCTPMITGCYGESDYSGDGKLTDNGSSVATYRYVLNLGLVELNRQNTATYRISNLPDKMFVAGIDLSVDPDNQDIIAEKKLNTVVSLTIFDSEGKKIFDRKSDLASWSWSRGRNTPTYAFIYGSGSGLEETYFYPEPKAEYKLAFTVHKVDPNTPKHSAVLLLKSGGWK